MEVKTAISIPDEVFKAAEKVASRRRMSRSHLYTEAIRRYLAEEDKDAITDRLNEVYQQEDSSMDPVLLAMSVASMDKDEDW